MLEKTKRLLTLILQFWVPFLLWAAVIYSFSSSDAIKTSAVHWQDFIVKKTAHITEYFIFALLLYRALVNSRIAPKNALICVLVTALLYGTSDEFHQTFTPTREPTIRDVLIDFCGSLIFVVVMRYLVTKSKKLTDLAKVIQLIR
ncbi:MAG: Acetobutylicum phosphotransbutyrylase [Candidatus Woesebacteria bacterium GW2011_GWA1_39_21]|uniref:Acetobutylicum phosphotransbutyrylase n=1 Tax=Candidatus Woesebacteria bacterium GW2011_GWA1_39_21 TaxID=1618550 RepID=A0A0G0N3A7_9BACT|nr:MAG: Acetobutylicum phosphotransbutyrylase [Candidatus Woesebacteria bacterium GW2011_GWA1_39_21]